MATTPLEARQAARNLSMKLAAADEKNSQEFKDLLTQLNETPLDQMPMEELSALLNLPEDQFMFIAPAFIEEFEKDYNILNNQLLLVQTINLTGRTLEDIEQEFIALDSAIDDLTALSAQKRDFLKRIVGTVYNAIANADGIAKATINVPIEYCHPDAKMPNYAHVSDSGMDVYALDEITIAPGETKLIPLGIKVAIPLGYELQVRPKSGRSLKTKLRIANTPGTIDAGYRDEVGVIIENVDPPIRDIKVDENGKITSILYGSSYTIGQGEKFAQLVLAQVPKVAWYEVDSVADDADRGGGFGSTGLK